MIRGKSLMRKGIVSLTLAAAAVLVLSGPRIASAQQGTTPVRDSQKINYFAGTAAAALTTGTVNAVDPLEPNDTQPPTICAMYYIFDDFEQLQECCGCPITSDGLQTTPFNPNLVTNTFTGTETGPGVTPPLNAGLVRIVTAALNGCPNSNQPNNCGSEPANYALVCDATGGIDPHGQYPSLYVEAKVGTGTFASLALLGNVRAWATHSQNGALTESEFRNAPLSEDDATNLAEACADIQFEGSGFGVCTCGTGS